MRKRELITNINPQAVAVNLSLRGKGAVNRGYLWTYGFYSGEESFELTRIWFTGHEAASRFDPFISTAIFPPKCEKRK
jgi:hypothetical protein